MKHVRLIVTVALVIVAAVTVFAGTQYVAGNYLDKQEAGDTAHAEVTCDKKGQVHHVIIENNTMVPTHTYAALCDVLKVTNQDNKVRMLAFGVHDHHQAYDGQEEKELAKGESDEVILNKVGTYKFHDHMDYRVQGDFTVKE